MPTKIFITGVDGFLGRLLVARMARNPAFHLSGLSRRLRHSDGNLEFVCGDLLNPKTYAAALSGVDTVIHLAAATGKHRPSAYIRVNRDGTRRLIEAAQQASVQRFLFVSTVAVLFNSWSERYYYANSKRLAEAEVAASSMNWTIVRPTMILGKGSATLAGLSRLASLPIVPVFGDGRTPLQPVFGGDLANFLAGIVENRRFSGETISVGGPEVLSIQDLLLRLRRRLHPGNSRVIHIPIAPVATLLGWVEWCLLAVLPITAGQLASFANAGTAGETGECWKTVDQMLDDSLNE